MTALRQIGSTLCGVGLFVAAISARGTAGIAPESDPPWRGPTPLLGAMQCRPGAAPMARVELYFGGHENDGPAWRRFVATVITPRFPDGLTLLDATGQWQGPRGHIREKTHVLIIFYRPDKTSESRIETIRTLYTSRFRQRSVLRADSAACVGF